MILEDTMIGVAILAILGFLLGLIWPTITQSIWIGVMFISSVVLSWGIGKLTRKFYFNE